MGLGALQNGQRGGRAGGKPALREGPASPLRQAEIPRRLNGAKSALLPERRLKSLAEQSTSKRIAKGIDRAADEELWAAQRSANINRCDGTYTFVTIVCARPSCEGLMPWHNYSIRRTD